MKNTLILSLMAFLPTAIYAQNPMASQDTIMKKDTLLKEVIITHRKPLITNTVDRTIVNVEAMISAATSNALEVLGKTPGVIVDNQGAIQLNGRGGVQILINGRPTYLSATDLAAYLRSIPGGGIDKIELMDNPPARYEASGNGVINIQLKRSNALGFSGQLSSGYSQGIYPRVNQSANLTYYTPRLRWYNNLGVNLEKDVFRDISTRTYFDDQKLPIDTLHLRNRNLAKRKNFNFQTGADYTLSQKTTIGLMLNTSGGRNDEHVEFSKDGLPSQLNGIYERSGWGANLNFLKKIDNKGTEWSGEVNHFSYTNRQRQQLQDFNLDVPVKMAVWSFNTDYVRPLGKTAKLETGYRVSYVKTDNEYRFEPISFLPGYDEPLNYPFYFQETIQGAYVNGQKKWDRFSAQVGLRAEHTSNKGVVEESHNNFKRDYLKLFPSVFLQYKLDSAGKNILALMANRRINRPNYSLLNPYTLYTDRYNYKQGNPRLNPQYMQRYELKYMRSSWLTASLGYSNFSGVIFAVNRPVDTVVISRQENIARGYMITLNTNIQWKPAKWWAMNTSAQIMHAALQGRNGHPNIRPSANIARIDWRNDFNFSNTLQAEFGARYTSKNIQIQSYTSPIYWFYASVQKKFLDNKASIRLSVDDIFRTMLYRNQSFGLNQLDIYQWQAMDSQRFGLAFTYSFGKKGLPKKSRNLEQAGEERSRIN